jgi:hypothetical protein
MKARASMSTACTQRGSISTENFRFLDLLKLKCRPKLFVNSPSCPAVRKFRGDAAQAQLDHVAIAIEYRRDHRHPTDRPRQVGFGPSWPLTRVKPVPRFPPLFALPVPDHMGWTKAPTSELPSLDSGQRAGGRPRPRYAEAGRDQGGPAWSWRSCFSLVQSGVWLGSPGPVAMACVRHHRCLLLRPGGFRLA